MPNDHIRIPLDLPGVRLVRQEVGPAGEVRIVVMRTTERERCPGCGRMTTKRHDARERTKADEPLGERTIRVVIVRRRFRCVPCQRVFTEPDAVCGTRRRLTRRLRERLGRECRHQTVQRLAQVHALSPTTVRRCRADVVATQQARATEPVTVLGIDEFSVRKGQRYATGLHDLGHRRVVDVVKGRTHDTVQEALERLPHPDAITVVSMDMAGSFRAAVQEVLPQATIVADKFHVVKRVTEAVRQVWQRLVHGKDRDDPLRTHGRLVLRAREHLSAAQRAHLEPLLGRYPSLRRAYLLKEDFRRWYRMATAASARLELRAWRRTVAELPDLPELRALAGMFALWLEEILNFFTHRVTQGFVEGTNNRAKVLERRAYGYRNVQNLRLQLMLGG